MRLHLTFQWQIVVIITVSYIISLEFIIDYAGGVESWLAGKRCESLMIRD